MSNEAAPRRLQDRGKSIDEVIREAAVEAAEDIARNFLLRGEPFVEDAWGAWRWFEDYILGLPDGTGVRKSEVRKSEEGMARLDLKTVRYTARWRFAGDISRRADMGANGAPGEAYDRVGIEVVVRPLRVVAGEE